MIYSVVINTDYPTTLGIHEFAGYFTNLITTGIANFLDAMNKSFLTKLDKTGEVTMWYEQNFAPLWEMLQEAVAELATGIAKLITIPIAAISEVVTSILMVTNEQSPTIVKELLAKGFDKFFDNIADLLHKLADFIGGGVNKLAIEEVTASFEEVTAYSVAEMMAKLKAVDSEVAEKAIDKALASKEVNDSALIKAALESSKTEIDLDQLAAKNNVELKDAPVAAPVKVEAAEVVQYKVINEDLTDGSYAVA